MWRRPTCELAGRVAGHLSELRRAKLGRCQRCQMVAAWGSVAWWSICLITKVAGFPAAWTLVTVAIAAAFTVLLAAHAVAFAHWMADALRNAQPSEPSFEPWTPREFRVLIARLTFLNLRASLFGGRYGDAG